MRMAIDAAMAGVEHGEAPFGACIVREGKILACTSNRVWTELDITAHAETAALRKACREANAVDLNGSSIYSTCEPCPMCFASCHWAKISKIHYGSSIQDALDLGFSELTISNRQMKELGGSPVQIYPGLLREDCLKIFRHWKQHPRAGRVY
jgi:Cytosine/adenosine deaminases